LQQQKKINSKQISPHLSEEKLVSFQISGGVFVLNLFCFVFKMVVTARILQTYKIYFKIKSPLSPKHLQNNQKHKTKKHLQKHYHTTPTKDNQIILTTIY